MSQPSQSELGTPVQDPALAERMSASGIDVVLTGLNHEWKIALLGSMVVSRLDLFRDVDIRQEFRDVQGEFFVHDPSKGVLKGYITGSMDESRVGLTKTETDSYTDKLEFGLTELGQNNGFAFMGHMGEFSLNHASIPLRMLGESRATELTGREDGEFYPTLSRVDILDVLSKHQEPLRIIDVHGDLTAKIGPIALSSQLKYLQQFGHVNFATLPKDKFDYTYHIDPTLLERPLDEIQTYQLAVERLLPELFDEMQTETGAPIAVTTADMARGLMERSRHFKDLGMERVRSGMSQALRNLYTAHLIERTGRLNDEDARTSVVLAESSRPAIKELLEIVQGMIEMPDDFIQEGTILAKRIMKNPEYVGQLVAKGLKYSRAAERPSSATTQSFLKGAMKLGNITQREIVDAAIELGATASRNQLSRNLSKLAKDGAATWQYGKTKGIRQYSLIEKETVA